MLLVLTLLINSLGVAGPASAMTTASHGMSNMEHSSYDASSCAGQCNVIALNKNTENMPEEEEVDKDTPATPFYSTVSTWNFTHRLLQQEQYADAVKPPPKVPIYIRYAVFRV